MKEYTDIPSDFVKYYYFKALLFNLVEDENIKGALYTAYCAAIDEALERGIVVGSCNWTKQEV